MNNYLVYFRLSDGSLYCIAIRAESILEAILVYNASLNDNEEIIKVERTQ